MLLDYGIGKQPATWHVLESKAPMYARVYYVLGGTTEYRSGSFHCSLKPGWLYIFPAHSPYEMTTDPADTLDCRYLHLDLHTANLSHLISVYADGDPELSHLLQVIRDGIGNDYPAGYLETLIQGFETLCKLKGLFSTVDPETARLIRAIRHTYRTDASVEEIAASLGYSAEYFIRLFRRRLGVTPRQYAISLRMSDAVRLLANGETLDAISAQTGYSDGHSFANSFRRYYGISPGVYRERYAKYV